MSLPLSPPIAPQLAAPAAALPDGPGWAYEPKLDGFRAIVFVDGDALELQSRQGKPLTRYFPEVTAPTGRLVLDGELVIEDDRGHQDFEALGQRIHPAASRIQRLAAETPARFVPFDLLAIGDEVLLELPFRERRARLLDAVGDFGAIESVATAAEAERFLREAEGVIAKELDAPYLPGERTGMRKIRRVRTADCVVMGYRPGKGPGVASLILGLYAGDQLRPIGHASGFKAATRRELAERLAPLETGHRGTGEPSRWASDRDLEWVELHPTLVAEVTFDHVSGGRIRHGAKLVRFRPDRDAASCAYAQLDA